MSAREPFPTLVVNEVWARCGGCCECTDTEHGHDEVCGQRCILPMQGGPNIGGWEAIAKAPNGPLDADNCMIVCAPCFKKLRAAGQI